MEDLQEFEERKDVIGFRASLAAAQQIGDKKAVRSIKSQLDTLIGTLSSLKVQEKRARYFDRVDSLRAQGLSTTDAAKECAPENTVSRKRSYGATSAIAQLMQSCTSDVDECSVEQRPKVYMELLVDYLAYRVQATSKYNPDTDDEAADKNEADSANDAQDRKKDKLSRCLLGCGSFRGRSELTKHYQRVHVKNGTFDRPFSCPECQTQEVDSVIEGGPSAWSNHAETVHGKIHAPNLPSYVHPVMGSSQCLLCEGYFMQGGLTRHIRRTHEKKEGIFNQPFSCPECHRQGGKDISIDGVSAWYDHVASTHRDVDLPHLQPLPALSIDRETASTRKRKWDEDDMAARLDEEAAVAVVSDWVEDMTITTDTAGTTPDMWTDSATSGSQSPATSVDSEIIQRIDPRLLSDRSRQGQKRVKSNQLDIEQENLEIDYVSSADAQPKDHSLFHIETISPLDVEPIEPILSTDCFHYRPDITPEQVQGATETKANPPPEETTISEPTLTDFEVSDPCGRSKNLLPNPHEDTSQVHLPSQAEFSQQAAQAEKEIEARPTPALTPDPEGLRSDTAKLWGRGYALAAEGRELNRSTNNARRREEISSNINPEHMIKGKRLRTRKS